MIHRQYKLKRLCNIVTKDFMDGFQVVKRRKQKRNPSVNILSIQHNTSRLVEEFNVERCKKKIIECRLGLQFNN